MRVTEKTLPLKALKAVLLILAMRLRRFLRLAPENPFIFPLVPPPRLLRGSTRFLLLSSLKETRDTDPPTAEDT